MNHHSVLGVAKNATKKEIKQAFVKLVKLYHPDTLQNDGNCKKIEAKNTAKFRQIHEAYKVLKDLPSTEYPDVNAYYREGGSSKDNNNNNSDKFDVDEWERSHGLGKYRKSGLFSGVTWFDKSNGRKLSKAEEYYERRREGVPRNPWSDEFLSRNGH